MSRRCSSNIREQTESRCRALRRKLSGIERAVKKRSLALSSPERICFLSASISRLSEEIAFSNGFERGAASFLQDSTCDFCRVAEYIARARSTRLCASSIRKQ